MKIAQIAPLMESVPPRLYGGTERIVSYLTEELVARGHEVTLFASGDSVTGAELVPCCEEALRLDPARPDTIPFYTLMMDLLRERQQEFDVLHFHIDAFHFPLCRDIARRAVTTLHGRQDIPVVQRLYSRFPEMQLVAISHAQARSVLAGQVVATIHHGIPLDLYQPTIDPRGGYVAFIGRMSPEKRPDVAIAIARAIGVPLKMAAKVDRADEEYFQAQVKPLLGDGIEFIGEVGEREKERFLGEARALLFPIDWPEPFGLVMIEAMACGTPTIAYGLGSVPEVIEHGVTGFIVNSEDEAVRAVDRAPSLDRQRCRRVFERRFSAQRMTRDYLLLYDRLIEAATVGRGKDERVA